MTCPPDAQLIDIAAGSMHGFTYEEGCDVDSELSITFKDMASSLHGKSRWLSKTIYFWLKAITFIHWFNRTQSNIDDWNNFFTLIPRFVASQLRKADYPIYTKFEFYMQILWVIRKI